MQFFALSDLGSPDTEKTSNVRMEYLINEYQLMYVFLGLGLLDPVPDTKIIWLFSECLSVGLGKGVEELLVDGAGS